jgi:hypothetical protein
MLTLCPCVRSLLMRLFSVPTEAFRRRSIASSMCRNLIGSLPSLCEHIWVHVCALHVYSTHIYLYLWQRILSLSLSLSSYIYTYIMYVYSHAHVYTYTYVNYPTIANDCLSWTLFPGIYVYVCMYDAWYVCMCTNPACSPFFFDSLIAQSFLNPQFEVLTENSNRKSTPQCVHRIITYMRTYTNTSTCLTREAGFGPRCSYKFWWCVIVLWADLWRSPTKDLFATWCGQIPTTGAFLVSFWMPHFCF